MSGNRQLVMVVGSGRSGTSVLAGILRELGYRIPQPEVVADATNPNGFAEPQWLVDFHSGLLRQVRVHTSDARPEAWTLTTNQCVGQDVVGPARAWLGSHLEASDHVVLKDPRLMWFTNLWEEVAASLGARITYLTMLRGPADVVQSKEHWYSMPLTATNRVAGWLNAMLNVELRTRDKERAYVTFDGLLTDWAGAIGTIDQRVGLPPVTVADERAFAAADLIVDPTVVPSRGNWEDLGVFRAIADLADRVSAALSSLADNPLGDDSVRRELDDLRREFEDQYSAAEQIAQSSIIAAGRRGRKVDDGAVAAESASSPQGGVSIKAARLMPVSWRHAIPVKARKTLLKYLP